MSSSTKLCLVSRNPQALHVGDEQQNLTAVYCQQNTADRHNVHLWKCEEVQYVGTTLWASDVAIRLDLANCS
jgi:ribosomal protein L37AE/L43A